MPSGERLSTLFVLKRTLMGGGKMAQWVKVRADYCKLSYDMHQCAMAMYMCWCMLAQSINVSVKT